MEQKDLEYLDRYELKLEEELVRVATTSKMLNGVLLSTEDIDAHWKALAPEYVADAIKEIAEYPVVSVAWAAYLGLAVAKGWDTDWKATLEQPYTSYYGSRGFDDLDEHVTHDLLGLELDSPEAMDLEECLRSAGEKTTSLIRHEQIEPQSVMAFHVFARSIKAMFRLGAAIELYRLGYKFEKMSMADLAQQQMPS